MIVDTSALLAFFDSSEPAYGATTRLFESADELLVVSPFVIAELDYLVLRRRGSLLERQVLDELASGAWELASVDLEDLRAGNRVVAQYADVPIGITDAMNVVLAAKYRTERIATLDRRHFSVLRLPDGHPPVIVP